MKIDECLVLGAGLGTRMGEIGKRVPKVLWPIFEKPLLELQIKFARELGCKRIFANTHYLHGAISSFAKEQDWPDVTLCHEPELLDVGGAIHNVARFCQGDHLLVLNGDLFLMLGDAELAEVQKEAECHLFTVPIGPGETYNVLEADGNLLKKVRPLAPGESGRVTYSGVSVVNLKGLRPRPGKSKFFDSVADYTRGAVTVSSAARAEYWDFGTIGRYYSSMFRLFDCISEGKQTALGALSIRSGAIGPSSIERSAHAYRTMVPNVLDFIKRDRIVLNPNRKRVILLDGEGKIAVSENGIYWNGLFAPVPCP